MKYASSKGHTLRGADYGASGLKEESILTREVGYKVDAKLKSLGYEVIDCHIDEASSVGESLAYRVNLANNSNAEFFFEIHFNCGGGHGVEVFAISATDTAQKICNEIAALGYTNRGVKDGSRLYVVRNTNMPSILIECAFVDSKEDMDRYDPETLANAIVKGLTGKSVQPITNNQNQFNEGELFNQMFSEKWYLLTYKDIADNIKNGGFKSGKEHYLTYGRKEGRKPCPPLPLDFNEGVYLESNSDIKKAVERNEFSCGVEHYLMWGFAEGRKYK